MLSLKIVKGAELAEGVLAEMRVPQAQARFVIGRDPSAHWPIPDRTLAISARHCEIVSTPAGMALRDLSTNGTFVNGGAGRIGGDHLLADGDHIQLGPYTIVVQGAPKRAAPAPDAAPQGATASRARHAPSLEAPAPVRGGDPAAMLRGIQPARTGLTEILRNAPPTEESGLELTKIRLAPKVGSGPPHAPPATRPADPPPPPVVPASAAVASPAASQTPVHQPVATARPDAPDVLTALARGLDLPPDALAGRDPAQVAAQVATLARAGVHALRQLLERQAQSRQQIGSRATARAPLRDANPLRLAPSDGAALQALLGPDGDAEAALERAVAELASHLAAAYDELGQG